MTHFRKLTSEEERTFIEAIHVASMPVPRNLDVDEARYYFEPWAAPVLHALRPRLAISPAAQKEIRTLGVTKDLLLLINWDYFTSHPIHQRAGLLIHEAWHILHDHHGTAEALSAHPFLSNLAGDYQINGNREDILPDDLIFPRQKDLENGKDWGYYYKHIMQEALDEHNKMKNNCPKCSQEKKKDQDSPQNDENQDSNDQNEKESDSKNKSDKQDDTKTSEQNSTDKNKDNQQSNESKDQNDSNSSDTCDDSNDNTQDDSSDSNDDCCEDSSSNGDDSDSGNEQDDTGNSNSSNGDNQDDSSSDESSDNADSNSDSSSGNDSDSNNDCCDDSSNGDDSNSNKDSSKENQGNNSGDNGPECTCPKSTCSGGTGAGTPLSRELEDELKEDDGSATVAEVEKITHQTAENIRSSVGIGITPGMKQWAEDVLAQPTVPWRDELKAAASIFGNLTRSGTTPTYKKTSRRRGHFQQRSKWEQQSRVRMVHPRYQTRPIRTLIVVDTSGSMGKDRLQAALGEVSGILNAVPHNEVYFSCLDMELTEPERIHNFQEVTLEGGGGTDMSVAVNYVNEKNDPPYNVLVILTDNETYWECEEPETTKVIVGCVDGNTNGVPEWAKAIPITLDHVK